MICKYWYCKYLGIEEDAEIASHSMDDLSYEAVKKEFTQYYRKILFDYNNIAYSMTYYFGKYVLICHLLNEQETILDFKSAQDLFEQAKIEGYPLKDIWDKIKITSITDCNTEYSGISQT